MVRIGSELIEKRDLTLLSGSAEEYNKPERLIRPVEFTDIPMYEDHVGPVRPHILNMTEAQKQKHVQDQIDKAD